jgi:hypothetical protein
MTADDWTDEPGSATAADASLDEGLADMRKREADEIPTWFLPLLGGAIIWIAAGLWLQHKINYPDAYGFPHTCGVYGFACWPVDLIHSPALLERPTGYSLALFAWYMSMLAALLAILIHAATRKPRGKYLLSVIVLILCFAYLATDPTFQRVGWKS